MLADYLLILNWLLIAIGVALLGGTGLALLHYRRTGAFPGQPAVSAEGQSTQASPRTAIAKCIVGAMLIVWGVFSLLARWGA